MKKTLLATAITLAFGSAYANPTNNNNADTTGAN